jgi:tetratricopeptide (TPR) repeat protein
LVQTRLARLIDSNRASLPIPAATGDRVDSKPALREAETLANTGDVEGALAVLREAERADSDDPRIPFQIGDLLSRAGRHEEAAESYRRTLSLDVSRARVFFQLGLAYRETGQRHRAVYAFEQASMRAGEASPLRERAEWEVFKLTFTVLSEVGFADGSEDETAGTPLGAPREAFPAGARRMAWWARLNPRFRSYSDEFLLRWTGPGGRVVQQREVERFEGSVIGSVLKLRDGAQPGEWSAELLLADELVDRSTVQVQAD